jgi:hypothetical protein
MSIGRCRILSAGTGLSTICFFATALMCVRSEWRDDTLIWTHDTPKTNGLVRVKMSIQSFRAGFNLAFEYSDAKGNADVRELLDYYQWHPHGFERWSESAREIDAAFAVSGRLYWFMAADGSFVSTPPPKSYRFMPNSPALLGFQRARRSGLYKNTMFWSSWLAIPYWFPLVILAVVPVYRFWRRGVHARLIARGLCPHCGYDMRAMPTRCPECGSMSDTLKSA